jgi:hypothetical protein
MIKTDSGFKVLEKQFLHQKEIFYSIPFTFKVQK